jgi:hypothetical protein
MDTAEIPTPPADSTPSGAGNLESAKLRSEVLLNRAERALKRIEARRLLAKPHWIELTVPGATVIVALVGFFGTFAATYLKGWSDLELTRQRYDSELVLKAVVADAKQTRENIRFLLESGLLKDADGKLAKAVANPNLSIRIASQAPADLRQDFTVGQMATLVEEIKKATGVSVNISLRVMAGEQPNAWAAKLGDGRFEIAYTQDFIDGMRRKAASNWPAYAIVAHEMGHIGFNHFEKSTDDSAVFKALELEADKWAGAALAKLGASLVEAKLIHVILPTPEGSPQYPSQEERLEAIANGWNSGTMSTPVK